MAALVQNISSDSLQRHTLLFEKDEIVLTLKFMPSVEQWLFDVEYKEFKRFNVKLAVDTLHMESENQPFDFAVQLTDDSGLDPFRLDDFSDGRCELILMEASDMEEIRGAPVAI